jgi:hypothetical protein
MLGTGLFRRNLFTARRAAAVKSAVPGTHQ